MSLTSPFFLGFVFLLTVGAFVVLVLWWPRFSGDEPARIASRVGMLLLVNVLVLLTAATQLNAQFLFFASWGDLSGAMTGHMTRTTFDRGQRVDLPARKHVAGAAARVPDRLPQLPNGSIGTGGVGTFAVHGPLSGLTATVNVQVPAGYLSRANARRTYPVLEAFPGYPGTTFQWIGPMNLGSVMATQVALGHMKPALIVEPQSWIPPGVDTECVNGRPGNPQVETWLTRDVPNWVTHTFRVIPRRSAWAAIGLSAGGWCAAMASMLHPAQYGAAVVMGGYFRPDPSPFYEPYPPTSPLVFRYDLVPKARHNPPPVAMWMETSHADPLSYRSSIAFLRAARPPLGIHAVVLRNAGHRISVWQALLPESMQWLGTALPGF